MKLYDLIKGIARTELPDIEITALTSDNRVEIPQGAMFVCIKGKTFDGHSAARQMSNKGAAVIVAEHDLGLENQIIVSDTRSIYPKLCAAWFGNPEKQLKLIGVTGTTEKQLLRPF